MKDSNSAKPDATSTPERDWGDTQAERGPVGTSTGTANPRTQPGRKGRRILRIFAMMVGLVLLVLGLAAAAWTLGRSTDTLTESFSGPIDQVVVDDVNGRVTFEAGTASEVTVEREWLLAGPPDVEIVYDDGTLRIIANCGSFCRTHVSGSALAGVGIVVRTEAGDIEITGLEGGADLTTSAGNVTVTDIRGPATLRTDAGWIRGDISDGDVDAQTSAGGIDLEVVGDFSRISAVSDAGSVRLAVPDHVYRVDADTPVGSTRVNVTTDPGAAREIVARSDAGNVTIDRIQR